MRRMLSAVLLASALSAAAAPSPKPPLDFSGTWQLDERASVNVSPKMKGALLVVEQRGDRIRISPEKQAPGKLFIAADELVVDGQPYEKSTGNSKGVVTTRWSADGQALEINVTALPTEARGRAVQTARWTLSRDGSTWVRETHAIVEGKESSSRLVFRRQAQETPAKTPSPKPGPKK